MTQIIKIKRQDLNVDLYTKNLRKSINYIIYAEVWYLDLVTSKNWFCYVINDFEVFMPIPCQRILGFNFISQPVFCQQLGIFSNKYLDYNQITLFLNKIKNKIIRNYSFNQENKNISFKCSKININYILNLNQNYEQIYKKFNKGLKQNIKIKDNLKIETKIDFNLILNLIQKNYENIYSKKHLNKLEEILFNYSEYVVQKNLYLNDCLLGSNIFLKCNNYIINLIAARNKQQKCINISSIILNDLIKEYSDREVILDFEGSNNPQKAYFFSSFGTIKKEYFSIKNYLI